MMGADLYYWLCDQDRQATSLLKDENQKLRKQVADLEHSLKGVLEELSPDTNVHHRSLVINALMSLGLSDYEIRLYLADELHL